ncbi:MAG TPA: hypothetical protein PLJ08_21365, partial [Cyclobacteriaceae bacterium]|nr:hypothetical protein [Cyclobacteriaceae bacterium]
MKKIYSLNSLAFLLLFCTSIIQAQIPDDSPQARDAAIARLKNVTTYNPCEDASTMTRAFGTTCY